MPDLASGVGVVRAGYSAACQTIRQLGSALRQNALIGLGGKSFEISAVSLSRELAKVGSPCAFLRFIMEKQFQTNRQDPKTELVIAPAMQKMRMPRQRRKARAAENRDGKSPASPAIPPASVYFIIELA